MHAPTSLNALALLAAVVGVGCARTEGATTSSSAPTAATAPADVTDDAASPSPTETLAAPPVLRPAPPLTGLEGWLQNGDLDGLDDRAGEVTIVQFWTFGCHNCRATLPHLQDIYATYRDDGLEIIGVHAPEFAYEKDVAAIAAAARDLGVTWPIALDTDKSSFRGWQEGRRFWPRTYVVDQHGQIRFDRIGEGAYDELEATVARLLADPAT